MSDTTLGELYRATYIPREKRPVECCRVKENCEPHQLKADLVVERCKMCGRRHFEFSMDPGKLGIFGAGMG